MGAITATSFALGGYDPPKTYVQAIKAVDMAQIESFVDPGLLGVWRSHEGEISQVSYYVASSDGGISVTAIDGYDNERAEVSDVRWDARTRELLFTCYWTSTGRLAKCRFLSSGGDTVQFTYQYTDHELLVRGDA